LLACQLFVTALRDLREMTIGIDIGSEPPSFTVNLRAKEKNETSIVFHEESFSRDFGKIYFLL
jgi:hypothetical protein